MELTTDASDVQDVNDADKSSKSSKKGWNWFSRQKDTSTAAPVTDDDEELREQGSIAAEASPVNAVIQDPKACSPHVFDHAVVHTPHC